ncbi:MAG: DUF4279 domain-containing protein [Gammaproteobacteria bacterium]
MAEKPDEIKVSLKITDFNCDPNSISEILGLEPTTTWLEGDRVHPKAIIKHKQNGWVLQSPLPKETPFRQQLQTLLDMVTPKKQQLLNLPSGTDIEVSCVVYSEHGRPDISLEPDMVAAIAEMRAGLDFDLYTLADD